MQHRCFSLVKLLATCLISQTLKSERCNFFSVQHLRIRLGKLIQIMLLFLLSNPVIWVSFRPALIISTGTFSEYPHIPHLLHMSKISYFLVNWMVPILGAGNKRSPLTTHKAGQVWKLFFEPGCGSENWTLVFASNKLWCGPLCM